MKSLLIIMPAYNEELVLVESGHKVMSMLEGLINENLVSDNSAILFVNDGSADNTWQKIVGLHSENTRFKGINLATNFGHQNALIAGLENSVDKYDMYITLDVDLQDDIGAIPIMIQHCYDGSDIVFGVRKNRSSDSFLKKFSAQLFYKIQLNLGLKIIYNHADYRLISNAVLGEFLKYRETNIFLRAIFPRIGFTHSIVGYDRQIRTAGESKYTLFKMINFAVDGITSFSMTPLRIVTYLGFTTFFITTILAVWVLYVKIAGLPTLVGWASTVLPIYFIASVQMISIGIIGEYLGKMFMEVKNRPRYHIRDSVE